MIRGQVLGGSCVMPIEEIFSADLRVHDSVPPLLVSSSANISALVASGGLRGPMKPSEKGNVQGKSCNSFPPCKYCRKMSHLPEKC